MYVYLRYLFSNIPCFPRVLISSKPLRLVTHSWSGMLLRRHGKFTELLATVYPGIIYYLWYNIIYAA